MDELSNIEIGASQPTAGETTDLAGDNLTSASKSILVAALSYTQGAVDNVIPPAIPGQSPVVTGQHSIPPDNGCVQPLVDKISHDINLFQPTKQSSVDAILCELNSTRHAVGSSQPPACVEVNSIQPVMSYIQPPLDTGLSEVNSLSPAMGPDQLSGNTVLHSIQPTVDLSQSPAVTGAHDVNSLQPSMSTNQPTVNTHLHELSSVQKSMCSIQPHVHTVLCDVNSMQPSVSLSKDTCFHEPTVSSLQMPVGTDLPDVTSISPEVVITQPCVEISMHDIHSLQPSFSLSQQPVEVVSSEVNPVQHAVGAAQSVNNSLPIVPRVPRTKRSFTTQFKLECVEHAERTRNKTQTARIFNVNRRRVQEWCTQKERLMSVPKEQKRLSGAGKRQMSIDAASKGGETDGKGGKVNHEQKSPFSKNELDYETLKDFGLSMPTTTIDPTLFDCIARNLSNIDHSMLSASMVKMLQEWSDLTSQDSKTTIEEPVAQGTVPMEDVLQKRTDSSPSSQFFGMEVIDGGNLTEQPMEVGMGSEGIPDSVAQHSTPAVQQEIVAAEYLLGTNNGHKSVSIEGPLVNIGLADVKEPVNTGNTDVVNQVLHTESKEGEAVGKIPDPASQHPASVLQQSVVAAEFSVGTDNKQHFKAGVNEHVVNTKMTEVHTDPKVITTNDISPLITENAANVPVAILDALMQVASVQLAPMEQMTIMETSTLPSEQQPVALVLNGTGDRAKVEASPSPITIRTRVKKSYTVEFKLDCIAHAESTSKCAAARQFNVDRRRVQDWCSKKEKLQKLTGSQHMLREAKEQMDTDVEKQLAAWVKRQQEAGEHLTRKMVGDEATRIYQEKGDLEFVSSIGWVAKFMIRNNISLVSRTRLPLHLPLVEVVVDATTSSS